MIDAELLLEAAKGHIELFDLNGIAPALDILGLDNEEVRALGKATQETRFAAFAPPTTRAAYAGGFLDGLVLGVRAARLEAERG